MPSIGLTDLLHNVFSSLDSSYLIVAFFKIEQNTAELIDKARMN